MRFLTIEESRLWLEPSGIEIDEYGRPTEPYTPPRNVFALTDPQVSSPHVVRAAMDWLPVGRERLILVSEADTYPPDLRIVFEAIRRGCGASSDVGATPGHLFVSTKAEGADYEDRPAVDVFEESIAMWIGGLALEWTWPGVIAAKACDEFIELGDGYMRFVSPNASRLEQAVALSAQLGLHTLDRFPWNPPVREEPRKSRNKTWPVQARGLLRFSLWTLAMVPAWLLLMSVIRWFFSVVLRLPI